MVKSLERSEANSGWEKFKGMIKTPQIYYGIGKFIGGLYLCLGKSEPISIYFVSSGTIDFTVGSVSSFNKSLKEYVGKWPYEIYLAKGLCREYFKK